jgi:hypothetical protein
MPDEADTTGQPPDPLNGAADPWRQAEDDEARDESRRAGHTRTAVDPSTLDAPPKPNDARGTLEAMRTEQAEHGQAFDAWLRADPERNPPSVTTTIVVDGIPVRGAPLDETAQAAFVDEVRAARKRSSEEIAAIEAAQQGARRCPI